MNENRFTYLARLWIDSSECTYTAISDLAHDVIKHASDKFTAIAIVADFIRDLITDENPVYSANDFGMYSDLMSAAIESIDVNSIATYYVNIAIDDMLCDE